MHGIFENKYGGPNILGSTMSMKNANQIMILQKLRACIMSWLFKIVNHEFTQK